MLFGLAAGLLPGRAATRTCSEAAHHLLFGLAAGVLFGFAAGLLFGFAAGLLFGFAAGVLFGFAAGLLFGFAAGLLFGLAAGLLLGLAAGLLLGLAAGLLLGLAAGLLLRFAAGLLLRFAPSLLLGLAAGLLLQRCASRRGDPRSILFSDLLERGASSYGYASVRSSEEPGDVLNSGLSNVAAGAFDRQLDMFGKRGRFDDGTQRTASNEELAFRGIHPKTWRLPSLTLFNVSIGKVVQLIDSDTPVLVTVGLPGADPIDQRAGEPRSRAFAKNTVAFERVLRGA